MFGNRWYLACLVSSHVFLMSVHTTSAQEKFRIQNLKSPNQIAFSPDGKLLAFEHYPRLGAITLWNVEKKEATVTINDTKTFSFLHMRFSVGGNHIVVPSAHLTFPEMDGAICFVDIKTGQVTRKAVIKAKNVLMDVSANGQYMLTCGTGADACNWSVTELTTEKSTVLKGEDPKQRPAKLSPDGSLAITAEYHVDAPIIRVKAWETKSGKLLHTLTNENWTKYPPAAGFEISPNNKILAVQGIPHLGVQFFDLITGKELGDPIPPLGKRVIWPVTRPVAFLPDDLHVAIVDGDKRSTVEIWNVKTLKKVHVLRGAEEKMGDINIIVSADGKYLARRNRIRGDGAISVWELPKLK